jgi:opacity protein-like surface antigen
MKKTNKVIAVAVAGVLLGISNVYNAASTTYQDNHWYISGNIGASIPLHLKNQSFNLTNGKPKSKATFGAEIGYNINDNFKAALGMNYIHTTLDKFALQIEDVNGPVVDSSIKLKSLVTELNVYYDIYEIKGFTPYTTAGFGLARNHMPDWMVKTNYLGTIMQGHEFGEQAYILNENLIKVDRMYKSQYNSTLSWNVGVGVNYQIRDNIQLNLEYKYRDLGTVSSYTDTTIAAEEHQTIGYNAKLKTNTVLFGMSYRF